MIPPSSSGVNAPRNLARRVAMLLLAAAVTIGVPLVAQALDDESSFESALSEPADPMDSPSPRLVEGPEVATRPAEQTPAPAPVEEVEIAARPAEPAPAPVEEVEVAARPAEPAPAPEPVAELEVAARPAEPAPEPVEELEPPDAAPEPDDAPSFDPAADAAFLMLTDTYDWDERSPRVAALQQMLGVDADGWYAHTTNRAHRAALELAGLPTDTLPAPVLPPGPSASQWAALRDCESGGDYSITNPSGKYRGAYQFDRSTWNSVATRHAPDLVGVDPAAASPVDQDAMAFALYSERGARPWPHCGRHLP